MEKNKEKTERSKVLYRLQKIFIDYGNEENSLWFNLSLPKFLAYHIRNNMEMMEAIKWHYAEAPHKDDFMVRLKEFIKEEEKNIG